MPTRSEVLQALPPVRGRREVLKDEQETKDIIREVVEAHQFFAKDYDAIAPMFYGPGMFKELFGFLKKNVRYAIETKDSQTTRSPAALIAMAHGDCKHYAGFIGGVLDALKRKGYPIDWKYRFASYDMLDATPQHVFVVVNENGGELWIDPVLSEIDKRSPQYYFKQDKKPSKMLSRIYGAPASVGLVGEYYPTDFFNPLMRSYFTKIFGTSLPVTSWPVRFFVDGQLFNLPTVEAYKLREQGKAIPKMPQGLTVKYPPVNWQGKPMPPEMLYAVVTPEFQLKVQSNYGSWYDLKGLNNGSTNAILCADNNRLLNLLAAALGCIQMAYQPYPDAENLQRHYDNILRLRDRDFFYPREVKTFVGSVWEGIKDAVSEIGEGLVKFIGIIPRQAFLLAVKINGFNMARNLSKNIAAGREQDIRKKWEGFGGEYSVLLNNINEGKDKKAILGSVGSIGAVEGVGELTLAAALAAAAPVIALLGSLLKAVGGEEVDKIVDDSITKINSLLVAAGEDPIALSESLGGKPVQVTDKDGNVITIPAKPGDGSDNGFVNWIKENPVAAAGGAAAIGVGVYALSKKKRSA